jgi:hypothetical protein
VEGFTKNSFQVMQGSYIVAVLLLILVVILHLLPYGAALTGDWAAIAVVILATATRVVLFRSLRYRLDNALFLHPLMVILWAWIMLRSMWFTGVRKQIRWRGRTYDAAQTRFGAER